MALVISGCCSLWADSVTIPIPTWPIKKGTDKRDSTSVVPQCYYSDGSVIVYSSSDWSYVSVTVSHDSSGVTYSNAGFLDESVITYIGNDSGTYSIIITTDSGTEYAGSLEL